jgi:hypothetical protein
MYSFALAISCITRGNWQPGEYGLDEDISVTDMMNVSKYDRGDFILNGWFSERGVPTRRNFLLCSGKAAKQYHSARRPETEEVFDTEGEAKQLRVVKKLLAKSTLRQMVHDTEIEDMNFHTQTTLRKMPTLSNWANTLPDLDDLLGDEDVDEYLVKKAQSPEAAVIVEPIAMPVSATPVKPTTTEEPAATARWVDTLPGWPEDGDAYLTENVAMAPDPQLIPATLHSNYRVGRK